MSVSERPECEDQDPVSEAFYVALGHAVEDFAHEVEKFPYDRPLYHYASSHGFLGITKAPRRIWATDARCLNDESEVAYGRKLLEAVVELVRAEDDTPPAAEYLDAL